MHPETSGSQAFAASIQTCTPVIGRFYGPERAATREYAAAAAAAGLNPYPSPAALEKPIYIQNAAEPNDRATTFYFCGTLEQADSPATIQQALLNRMDALRPGLSALVGISENGYLGLSASAEVAYLMAQGAFFALSRSVTRFATQVDPNLQDIIANHQAQRPIIPPDPKDLTAQALEKARAGLTFNILSPTEQQVARLAIQRMNTSLTELYPGTTVEKYAIYAPSTQQGKVAGSVIAARAYQRAHLLGGSTTLAMQVDARKFASGTGQERPNQPIAYGNYQPIQDAALVRISQFESVLEHEPRPLQGAIRLIVAQESGIYINPENPGFGEDVTICAIKNLDTGWIGYGRSDAVLIAQEDIDLIQEGETIGIVVARLLKERCGIEVDHQDWYEYYHLLHPDIPELAKPQRSRAHHIAQASMRAAQSV